MTDVSWIKPQDAGWMVAANYCQRDILNGKPQKLLLDWVMQGHVASMARRLSLQAPDLPSGGLREENVLLTVEDWSIFLPGNCDLTSFYRASEVSAIGLEGSRVTFKGIRVSKEDVISEMDLAGWPMNTAPTEHSSTNTATPAGSHDPSPKMHRGRLPTNASAAARRHEEYAHSAAELVRAGKKLSEALRVVAPSDPTRVASSVEQAIRRTFDLMYDKQGNPL